VEMLGERWSLLIIRDMMLQGAAHSYKTFLECYEGIATNILVDRLRKLAAPGNPALSVSKWRALVATLRVTCLGSR
jgi:hypothetical protein